MAPPSEGRSVGSMRYGDHMDAGGWVFMVVAILLLVALAIATVVWLSRSQGSVVPPRIDRGGEGGSARDLLDRRLVTGEIGEDEYRRLRNALSDAPAPSQPADEPAHGG